MRYFDAKGCEVREGVMAGIFLPVWVRVGKLCPEGRALTWAERRAEVAFQVRP